MWAVAAQDRVGEMNMYNRGFILSGELERTFGDGGSGIRRMITLMLVDL